MTARPKKNGWSKPQLDWVKLNVDASFDADTLRATIGAVIRDHQEAAEAHAVCIGLELATLSGCFRVLVNSDSSDVVQAISSGNQPLSAAAAIYEDCFRDRKSVV